MGEKREYHTAVESVREYYRKELEGLVERAAEVLDSYRSGELDVYAVEEGLAQYSRGAAELRKFCDTGRITSVARQLAVVGHDIDWWQEGAAPRRR